MKKCRYDTECCICPKAVPLKRYDSFLMDIIYCYCTLNEEFTQIMPEAIYDEALEKAMKKTDLTEENNILDEFEEDLLI